MILVTNIGLPICLPFSFFLKQTFETWHLLANHAPRQDFDLIKIVRPRLGDFHDGIGRHTKTMFCSRAFFLILTAKKFDNGWPLVAHGANVFMLDRRYMSL